MSITSDFLTCDVAPLLLRLARGAIRCRDNAARYRAERDAERAVLMLDLDERSVEQIAHARAQLRRLQSALHDYRAALVSVAAERDFAATTAALSKTDSDFWYRVALNTADERDFLVAKFRTELRERAEAHQALHEQHAPYHVLAGIMDERDAAIARAEQAEADRDKARAATAATYDRGSALLREARHERDAAMASAERCKAEMAELRGRRCGTCAAWLHRKSGTGMCHSFAQFTVCTDGCTRWRAKKGGE